VVPAIPLPEDGAFVDELDPSTPRNVEFVASQTEHYRPEADELAIRAAEGHLASLPSDEIASDNWAPLTLTDW
jgi:hypothetical protein